MLLLSLILLQALLVCRGALYARNSTGLTDDVTWDPHSLSIFGQRIFILSAEVRPWRIPGNPVFWRDILEKVKANGFNTVSFYVNWATHYPTPDTNEGMGDFEENTYRDIQLFIDTAKDVGLWLIARPGPYINAETTGGGFPGWVGNIAGDLRSSHPDFTETWVPYMTSISQRIARNQITEGGPIILVQAENEFSAGQTRSPYMQAIIDLYRANGIVIPIIHNDQHAGQAGNFSPDRPGPGQVNIYCGDSYPQGQNRWAQVQSIYRSAHVNVAPNNPLCLAEFGGGFLVQWGEGTFGGTGFEKYSQDLTDASYENIFYKENYAQTTTILNIYMLFGGTNWGQTAAPVSFSSYDYGGGINENRVATSKMNEMRLQGLFLRVSRDLLGSHYVANGTNYTISTEMYTTELRNSDTGAAFYVLRHTDSTSMALTTTQLRVETSGGMLTIPRTGNLTFNGRDSKIIVTDYVFGNSETKILYSTAEILTYTTIDDTDYIIFYAGREETGETAFLVEDETSATLDDAPGASSTFSDGVLTINYTLSGRQSIRLSRPEGDILVILLEKATANTWHAPVISSDGTFGKFFSVGSNDTVFVSGPYLVRNANIEGDTLSLIGDLNGTTTVETIAPAEVTQLIWNSQPVEVTSTAYGTLSGSIEVSESIVTLPTLENWKVSGSLPEISPDFDDSSFVNANLTSTNYTNLPPLAGEHVLYSQQYGFYGGNLIFRGHFNATGQETCASLSVQYGFAGGYSAWVNGVFLGSGQGTSTVGLSTDVWEFPEGALQVDQDNVLVVLQDHTGISETNSNGGKEPRGIRGYELLGTNTPISWKLQGNQGGAASTPDTHRGYLNEGGLYAERIGAHLPGFDDSDWIDGTPLSGGGVRSAGVNFFRTTFDLDIPEGVDNPVRLSITPSDRASNFRVQIYLNGWQVGKYFNSIGPQTLFVLPSSVLWRRSTNTLALSLWSLDSSGATIEGLGLVTDGLFATSLLYDDECSPDYDAQQQSRPEPQVFPPM